MEQTDRPLRMFGDADRSAPEQCEIFAPFRDAAPNLPFVVAQIGQSLDGRIATVTGESRDISGFAALDHLHRIRAHVDAVVVGAGTIVADDPQLTVRRVEGRSPARVAIDPRGRLGFSGKWLAEDGARRILVTAKPVPAPAGIELVRLPAPDGIIRPRAIIDALFAKGLRRLLIEGGATTIARFIEADCIDRLHALVAPIIIGSGRPGLDLPPIRRLDAALRPKTRTYLLASGDVLFDCDLTPCRPSDLQGRRVEGAVDDFWRHSRLFDTDGARSQPLAGAVIPSA
jgi:diaminohydroxyphosphoribosylaminopyrimidine deaminase / 5-amino-6-(5-phosphoribosylamino)uracil reductase